MTWPYPPVWPHHMALPFTLSHFPPILPRQAPLPGKFSMPNPHSLHGQLLLILYLSVTTSGRPHTPHLPYHSTISISFITCSTRCIMYLFVLQMQSQPQFFTPHCHHVFCHKTLKFFSLKKVYFPTSESRLAL